MAGGQVGRGGIHSHLPLPGVACLRVRPPAPGVLPCLFCARCCTLAVLCCLHACVLCRRACVPCMGVHGCAWVWPPQEEKYEDIAKLAVRDKMKSRERFLNPRGFVPSSPARMR